MAAIITAIPVKARNLLPGDLFSTAGPEYWAKALNHGSCGECVYIRTNDPADQFGDADSEVYRILIKII